jgi:hypothetical protein
MIQQWDFPVDEPVSLAEWRRSRLAHGLSEVATRMAHGETLRTLAAEYGTSHESMRRALTRAGHR